MKTTRCGLWIPAPESPPGQGVPGQHSPFGQGLVHAAHPGAWLVPSPRWAQSEPVVASSWLHLSELSAGPSRVLLTVNRYLSFQGSSSLILLRFPEATVCSWLEED